MSSSKASKDVLWLVGLIVAGVAMGKFQTVFRGKGRLDPLSMAVTKVTQPTARALSSWADGTANFLAGVGRAPRLELRVKQLEGQLSTYRQMQDTITQLQANVDQLKKLDGFPTQLGRTKIAANIIGLYAYENRVTLDVGSDQGVQPDLPVVTGQGLLGTIQTVSKNTCQAVLITSPSIQIGAMALRNPPAVGLLRGEDPSSLVLELLDPKANVQVGDDVTTSGFSSMIPRGIPIGRVIRIEDFPDFGTRRAIIFPWATVGASKEVYILK